jgi:hypothetical protein
MIEASLTPSCVRRRVSPFALLLALLATLVACRHGNA